MNRATTSSLSLSEDSTITCTIVSSRREDRSIYSVFNRCLASAQNTFLDIASAQYGTAPSGRRLNFFENKLRLAKYRSGSRFFESRICPKDRRILRSRIKTCNARLAYHEVIWRRPVMVSKSIWQLARQVKQLNIGGVSFDMMAHFSIKYKYDNLYFMW